MLSSHATLSHLQCMRGSGKSYTKSHKMYKKNMNKQRSRKQEMSPSGMSPFSFGDEFLTVLPEDLDVNNGRIDFQIPGGKTQQSVGNRFSLSRSNSSTSFGSPVKTIRDYDTTIKNLQKENFDLKLRIFLLEERCSKRTPKRKEEIKAGNLDHQLETCRKSLSNCIVLVEEAAMTIDTLEHKLEAQKDAHKQDLKQFEEKVMKYETILAEDSINNNMRTNDQDLIHHKNICSADSEVQCTFCQSPTVQDAYYDSVQLYRKVVKRLEGRVRWAREEWEEVDSQMKQIFDIKQEDALKKILDSKKNIFNHIFDIEDIYDEDEDDDIVTDWLLTET